MRKTGAEKIGYGKWSKKGVPHKGWTCVDYEDFGEMSFECEMCEFKMIRYIHHMEHPEYPDVLRVGRVCAENMEDDYSGAKKREAFLKSRIKKRDRWVERKWKISKNGNDWIEADGYIVIVMEQNYCWKAVIKNKDETFKKWSEGEYNSPDEIKLAAFDCITDILKEQML